MWWQKWFGGAGHTDTEEGVCVCVGSHKLSKYSFHLCYDSLQRLQLLFFFFFFFLQILLCYTGGKGAKVGL